MFRLYKIGFNDQLKKISTEDNTPFVLHTTNKGGIEIILTPTYHAQSQITINDEDAYEENISAPYYSKEFLKEDIELSNKQLINAINLIKKTFVVVYLVELGNTKLIDQEKKIKLFEINEQKKSKKDKEKTGVTS